MILEIKCNLLQKKNDNQLKIIDFLSRKIYDLEIENKEKEEITESVKSIREELEKSIQTISTQSKEYQRLIIEMKEMRKIMNKTVFKGRWKLIRLLMK